MVQFLECDAVWTGTIVPMFLRNLSVASKALRYYEFLVLIYTASNPRRQSSDTNRLKQVVSLHTVVVF
jgi:hypothetical protein